MRPVADIASEAPQLNARDTLRDALSLLLNAKSDVALVRDRSGVTVGTLRLEDIHAAAASGSDTETQPARHA